MVNDMRRIVDAEANCHNDIQHEHWVELGAEQPHHADEHYNTFTLKDTIT